MQGGVLLTVVGTLALGRMHEWRAGRRVRVTTELRRPGRFLNPGVPDQERALARHGTILVGTVKSGALVEVIAKGTRASEWSGRGSRLRALRWQSAFRSWSPRSAAIVSAISLAIAPALTMMSSVGSRKRARTTSSRSPAATSPSLRR